MSAPLAILRTGMCCPVGLDSAQVAATLRAGISRKSETPFTDLRQQPVIVGHLDEEYLPALAPELRQEAAIGWLERRLLRLATGPLGEVVGAGTSTLEAPLYLALPKLAEPFGPGFGSWLSRQSGIAFTATRMFCEGRVGLFSALAQASGDLLAGRSEFALVGGLDSYFDAGRLTELDRAGRLRTTGPQDAFTPGEAAAFVLLCTEATCERYGYEALAWLVCQALARGEPDRLGGLATAIHAAFENTHDGMGPIRTVIAGANGERRCAREWGVAYVRNRDRIAQNHQFHHPAEYIGDTGAAHAALMLATAAVRMHASTLSEPVLVWSSADDHAHGAALLSKGA